MSASVAEIQKLADQILERLGTRIRVGQVVICYHEGRLTRVETNIVHKPSSKPARSAVAGN